MSHKIFESKIRLRLLLYFAVSFLIFSIVLGALFFVLFSRQNMNEHKTDLEARAVRIAETLSGFFENNAAHEPGQGQGQGGGYGAYLRFLDDIAMTDVWVVDQNLTQITRGHNQSDIAYQELPPGAEAIIQEAINGKTVFGDSFGSFIGAPTLTVAMPILLGNGHPAGVVLLHEKIDTISSAAENTVRILLLCVVLSMLIAAAVATILAVKFTQPLDKMKTAATRVARGDYLARTNVRGKDEIGELAYALDEMTDKLGRAAKESAKYEKLRRDFIANVSHELKTPVTVIRGSVEALCEGVVSAPEKVAEYHRQMFSESVYMERLVSDLLDLARLQNPDFQMEMREIDLRGICEDAVRSIRRIAGEKRVDAAFSCKDGDFRVTGDYDRLRQMLLVVLNNAVKFSSDGDKVEISLVTDADTQKIMLTVKDNGCGISAEDLPHIFERFYKQRSEQNKSGSGLGLPIAKQIADRHGIDMTIESVADAGTTVLFSF